MDKFEQFIPKSGGVEQIDSDDDMYDNPDEIASLHSHGSQGGHSNKASDITNQTGYMATPNAIELGSDENDELSVNKYTITHRHNDNILSNTSDHHGNEYEANIIKIHNLNLNNRKQRLISLSIILFIWCIPTLILSLDFYINDQDKENNISVSNINNELHITSMIITLFSCISLLFLEFIEFRHFIINWCVGLLFIIGGCIHFVGTIIYAKDHCHDSKDTTHIDNNTGYCYLGYIGSSDLGALVPIILGIDVIWSILNNKHFRIIILSFILWITTLFTVIVLTKYGNGFGESFPGIIYIMDHKLFVTMCIGWWMLCISNFIALMEIIISIYILHLHKFKFDRFYMKLMNLIIGFCLILSISFILVEKDGCITGDKLSGDFFCYYRLIYVLIGLTCILSYELQTLSIRNK